MKKHQIKLFFTVNAAHFSLLSKRETQPFSWECYTQKQQCSKKEGKISNFYVPTYLCACKPGRTVTQCFDFLFTGISISLGLSYQVDFKKGENVHLYLQGKQSNWSKLDCLPPLILEHCAMAEAAAPYFGNCSGISGFDLAAGWWLAHVSTLL